MTPADVLSGAARWCVVHGDCLDVMKTLPDKSVTHVITDPPYSEHVHENNKAGKARTVTQGSKRRIISKDRDLGFEHLSPEVMFDVGHWIAFNVWRWSLVFSDVESSHEWRSAICSHGKTDYVRTGAWVKQGGAPQFTGDRPAVGFEAITICHTKGRKKWNGGGSLGVWRHPIVNPQASSTETREHTTQKPLSLMLELVELFTDPGDVVLDPFCGSGTTGVACLRLGRRFIGIEKDAKYAALATERLEAESKGLTLKDARAGQLSLLG